MLQDFDPQPRNHVAAGRSGAPAGRSRNCNRRIATTDNKPPRPPIARWSGIVVLLCGNRLEGLYENASIIDRFS